MCAQSAHELTNKKHFIKSIIYLFHFSNFPRMCRWQDMPPFEQCQSDEALSLRAGSYLARARKPARPRPHLPCLINGKYVLG